MFSMIKASFFVSLFKISFRCKGFFYMHDSLEPRYTVGLSESYLWENLAIWKSMAPLLAGSSWLRAWAEHPGGSEKTWNLALRTKPCKAMANLTGYFASCHTFLFCFQMPQLWLSTDFLKFKPSAFQKGFEQSLSPVGKRSDICNKLKRKKNEALEKRGTEAPREKSPCWGESCP